MRNYFNTPGRGRTDARLGDAHRRILTEGSAISPELVAESGARTITRGRDLPEVFSARQRRRGSGILFPVYRPGADDPPSWCFRPDKPDPDRPKCKYEQPSKYYGGQGNVLSVLPSQRHLVGRADVPVVFVEGQKKQLSLITAAREAGVEVLVVAIVGVWNWMADGKPIPDMGKIFLAGRRATIMFDSDQLRKLEVQEATRRLAEYLEERGAAVYATYFHDLPGGEKCGADDFFVAGGTFAELRLLTRRYDPSGADFTLVRLSRDEKLRGAFEDLAGTFWATAWKGMGGHSARDVYAVLIQAAAESATLHPDGLRVRIANRTLAREAAVSTRTLYKAIQRLEKAELIERDNEGRKGDKCGAFVLRASVSQEGTERGTAQNVTEELHTLYARDLHLRVPRLRWSDPGFRPKGRGVVRGTRRVRESPPREPRPAIKRLGKIRGALLDALLEAGGSAELAELCAQLHRPRVRDVRRRLLPMLLEAKIVVLEDDTLRLADDWCKRLDEVRRLAGEVDAQERDAARHRRQSRAFRAHRSGKREQPASKPSKAGVAAMHRAREKRERYLRENGGAEEDERRREVDRLVYAGMARRFAYREVYGVMPA